MKADLTRSAERWAACSPESVASGSEAQMRVFVADAKADIATLLRRIAALEAEASEAGCMCRGVEIGSHMASVSLPIPEHMADYREARVASGLSPLISVDACLVVELRLLWARGIRTYGSCCGHNKVRGMINVHEDDTAAMLAMGYAQWPEATAFLG